MTPNEITTVLSQKAGKAFDLPFKLILMEKVKALRSLLLKQTLEKTPADRKFFKSTIYLKLTEANSVPCSVPINCKVYVSDKLPTPLRANSILFDYVGAVDAHNPFKETHPGMVQFVNSGKYSKSSVPFMYSDNRLFVLQSVPMIRVDFIADDPMELVSFQCTTDEDTCDVWNTEYPLSKEILALILQMITEELKILDSQEDTIPVNPVNDVQL